MSVLVLLPIKIIAINENICPEDRRNLNEKCVYMTVLNVFSIIKEFLSIKCITKEV
jgi:hypothetical protein